VSNSWTAVYVNKRGGQVRFPLVEDENGKRILKISGESLPYQIGLNHPEFGTLIHFRTERTPQPEESATKTKEEER
jgi:hypothetical protein